MKLSILIHFNFFIALSLFAIKTSENAIKLNEVVKLKQDELLIITILNPDNCIKCTMMQSSFIQCIDEYNLPKIKILGLFTVRREKELKTAVKKVEWKFPALLSKEFEPYKFGIDASSNIVILDYEGNLLYHTNTNSFTSSRDLCGEIVDVYEKFEKSKQNFKSP
jgi:hypothetical protein